jgi:hypothetical protein
MTALVPIIAGRLTGADNSDVTPLVNSTAADTFPAGPNTYLRVHNTSASPVTVTVTPPAGSGPQGTTIAPYALAPTVAITTGDRIYGPFPVSPFGDGNGNVNFACTGFGSTVTIGAYVFPGA